MSLAENIYHHSRRLPEEAAREALDFIQFMEKHYVGKSTLPAQPKDTELFLAAIAGTLSDDFPDDIKDDFCSKRIGDIAMQDLTPYSQASG